MLRSERPRRALFHVMFMQLLSQIERLAASAPLRRPGEGGEVVVERLGAADRLDGAVRAAQVFGAAELAIVLEAHRVAVGARVVEDEEVAALDFGQGPRDGELVVVLAERARHVVDVVAGAVLLAEDGDVVVGAVERRPHEVGHAGVHAHVVAVGVLEVQDARDEAPVRPCNDAAALEAETDVGMSATD